MGDKETDVTTKALALDLTCLSELEGKTKLLNTACTFTIRLVGSKLELTLKVP